MAKYSDEVKAEHLSAFAASGLSVRAYCAEAGLTESTFTKWADTHACSIDSRSRMANTAQTYASSPASSNWPSSLSRFVG